MIERISYHQFMILSCGVLLGTAFLPIVQILAGVAGRDGWWSVMPGYLIAIPWGLMVLSFMRSYPGQNLLQISGKVFGKWVGKGIAVCYTLIAGYLTAFFIAREVDTYKRMIMPLMPKSILTMGIVLLVIALAWAGIEVLARFSEFTFPLIVAGFVITLILAIPRFEWDEFYPVLANGVKPILIGAVRTMPFAMEYILFLAGVLPFLPTAEQARLKSGLWRAVISVGILLTMVTLMQILIFGPVEAARLNLGFLSLGKMIEIAKTIAGIESVFLGVWLGAAILKITAVFYVIIWGLQYIFGFKKKFLLYLIVSIVLFIISMFQNGGTQVFLELSVIDNYLILPFALLWIPLLWLVERWRRRVCRT
ncbi:MAG: GerAB/ArcD/ProY family transporter [Desulfitobacteriaceae bacterium]